MRAGNRHYQSAKDIPGIVPVFPLSGALLLPGGNLPLNVFETRYLAMTDYALKSDRLIAMIQPDASGQVGEYGPQLYKMGCLGRLTGIQETGDGRYMINLCGVCRFEIEEELTPLSGFRMIAIRPNEADLDTNVGDGDNHTEIDRHLLIETFRKYLKANEMDTDWSAVERTDDETLVTALCMMSPYGPAEKQALLEACNLKTRAETLVAITEMAMANSAGDSGSRLQ